MDETLTKEINLYHSLYDDGDMEGRLPEFIFEFVPTNNKVRASIWFDGEGEAGWFWVSDGGIQGWGGLDKEAVVQLRDFLNKYAG